MVETVTKLRLLKILDILRKESDDEHYVETAEIIRQLAEMGIKCQRRTLWDDIKLLNENGYEILCEKETGYSNKYCLIEERFDSCEVHILLDAVQAATFISKKKTKELVNKIAALAGNKQGDVLKNNIVEFTTPKSSNDKILYAVSEIAHAIANRKKIKFNYFDYDENYKKVFRKNSKGEKRGYKVNPLGTVFDNGYYYLFCYDDFFGKVSHYRVDRMDKVEITELDMTPGVEKERENLPTRKSQLFAMYGGETATVEVQADKLLIDTIYDKFGDRVTLHKKDENTVSFTADVQVSPTFIAWCCSFGNLLKVTAPQEVVEKIKDYLEKTIKNYD